MASRDYETSPVADRLDLDNVIRGLCSDLELLRKGKITVNDAVARSLLAKQIFNGVRIYLTATKLLTGSAKEIGVNTEITPWAKE